MPERKGIIGKSSREEIDSNTNYTDFVNIIKQKEVCPHRSEKAIFICRIYILIESTSIT